MTNDYVFNMVSASSNRVGLTCHLCGHPPFSSRRLWKGHLFIVHGFRSTLAPHGGSVDVTSVDSVLMDRQPVPANESAVYEDASDDMSEESGAERGSLVCHIICHESERLTS